MLREKGRKRRRSNTSAGTERGTPYETGPWTGLRDSLDPKVSRDPQKLLASENMYPLELDKPSAFVGWPGFDQAGTQGGDTNKRTGQAVGQFTQEDGDEFTFRVVGGQGIQTYDWSLETWSTVVTVANLTTSSITLSETARVYWVQFNDKIIFSDGTNTPFYWTGGSGAAAVVSLTNAPVFYGQPTVYYNKLFAIKNTERNKAVWSEEDDPTIGYETSPYRNFWKLIQTKTDALVALVGENDRLVFLRRSSTGAIRGAVTPEFQTDGTREGIDETIGTMSPSGVVYADKRPFFVTDKARPHVVQGDTVVPLWADLQQTLRGIDLSTLSNVIALFEPNTKLVLFGMSELGQTDPSVLIAYNPVLNTPVSVVRGFTFQAIGIVKDASGVQRMMHLDSDGYAYTHGIPTEAVWDHGLNAGTAAIRHTLETCHLGVDSRDEQRFDDIDVLMRADADASEISIRPETPYGTGASMTGSVEGSGDAWDDFDWDDGDWSADTVERRKQFGLLPGEATGRWVRVRVGHEVLTEKFGCESLTAYGKPAGTYGEAP